MKFDNLIFDISNDGFAKRIDSLTSIRFFMIVMIFMSHLGFLKDGGNSIYDQYLNNPSLAVTYFFILSGFGLTYSSFIKKSYSIDENYSLKIGFKYAWRRVKKLYPLYLITMGVMVPIVLLDNIKQYGLLNALILDVFKCIVSIPLLQSIFGVSNIAVSFNGLCWFLSVLFILYIIYPILERLNVKYINSLNRIVISLIVLFVVSVIVHHVFNGIEKMSSHIDLSYMSPYMRIFHFAIGILICDLFIVRKKNTLNKCNYKGINLIEIAVVIIVVLWLFLRNSVLSDVNVEIRRQIDLVLASILVYVFAFQNGLFSKIILKNRILVFLGGVVMYIYLIHSVIITYTNRLLLFLNINAVYVNTLTVILSVLFTGLFTWLVYAVNAKVKMISSLRT
jgi:peptidoglycan/LPS O-acetylase OafA/YrhL